MQTRRTAVPLDPRWEKLAWVLDEMFRVPGTNLRFGLDALLGLVPGAGEMATSLVQAFLVMHVVSQREVPRAVALRMVANVAIDSAVGAIPFLGDVFDFFFKANTRNLQLLREVSAEHQITGRVSPTRHVLFLVSIGALLLGVLVLFGAAAFLIARALWQALAPLFG